MERFIKTAAAALLSMWSISSNAAVTYHLESGSELTVLGTGLVEPLTGEFTLEFESNHGDFLVFNVLSLHLFSPSVTIDLAISPPWLEGTSVFFSDDPDRCMGDICETFFGAVVEAVGLGTGDPLNFHNGGNGSYSGSPSNPETFSYTNLKLLPIAGGPFLARIDFTASPVPIPAPLVLLGSGLGCLFAARHRRRSYPAMVGSKSV